jgi:RsiW-degrading membrane proteinase PrsW (M82 family)
MRARKPALLVVTLALLLVATPALADDPTPESDRELARRYAPVLYFHPDEIFRPQTVDVIVEQARLRRSRRLWFDTNVLLTLDPLDLFHVESDRSHFLDVWYGQEGGSAYTNYSAHRAFYEATLSPAAGGPPVTVYAHVARDQAGRVTLQYWALYFYNDWFNKHEGDWEMMQVMLDADHQPRWVVFSQHHGGTRRAWPQAPVEGGTHPAAYVALGSHANYFVGDEIYPNTQEIGDRRIAILDRTGTAGRVVPDVILLPDRDRLASAPDDWSGVLWLPFRGRWGEAAAQGDFGGPLGPADKGQQWEHPYAWGMAQPLDAETWYANRLRVEVVGVASDDARVQLTDRRSRPLPSVEALGNLAILHADPPEEGLVATITVPPQTCADVLATWPDRQAEEVTHVRFADVDVAETGLARLELGPAGAITLLLRCLPGEDGATSACLSSQAPAEVTTVAATWDAPDLVWMAGLLPAHRVAAGLLLAVLASLLPTALYVGALYWLDRYEKEPRLLVTAAFLWGSIPALALALAAEIFFRLPPNLIGSGTLEAARLGLIAPLLQEALKGVAVLFIALRCRREFDNVLDGIVYGAVVGFGFAMTGNLIGYVSAFALRGFDGLSLGAFVEGLLYGLDHAFYTALFGAGLGLARLARVRWRRWAWPGAGFALSVAAHALHNLLGVDAVTVVTTGAGLALIGLVAGWSLRRQRRALRLELQDELPQPLYRGLVAPGGGARARWRALRTGGLASWRRTRRLHQRCAELAFKKMQRRRRPDEPALAEEIERLRAEIEVLTKRPAQAADVKGSS